MLEYYPPKNICENNQFILFCFQANKIWRPAKRLDLSKANDVLANKTKTVVESILIVWNTEKNIYILLCHCYKKRIKTCRGWREYVFCVPHLFTPPLLRKFQKEVYREYLMKISTHKTDEKYLHKKGTTTTMFSYLKADVWLYDKDYNNDPIDYGGVWWWYWCCVGWSILMVWGEGSDMGISQETALYQSW